MKRAIGLIGVLALALALLALSPAPALAEGKVLPHQQPAGGEAGGLTDYSSFDYPGYYYAGIRVPPSGTYYRQAGLSPDGTQVVAQKSWTDGTYARTEIVLMDADGSGEVVVSSGDSGQGDIYGYMNPFWCDDGTCVGYAEVHNANPNKIVRYDLGSASRTYIYQPVGEDACNCDFLGTSKTSIVCWDWVAADGAADLFVWDGSTRTWLTRTSAYSEYEPVSNADGSVILYWSGETTAEPVNTTHTLTYGGGAWTRDVGFTPIADSYWSYWLDSTATGIGLTVMSTRDVHLYDSTGAFVADLTGPGYSGGSGQWNFFGSNPQGPDGSLAITSNAGRGGTAGRDIVVAADRSNLFVDDGGSDLNPGTQAAPFATIQKALDEVAGSTITVGPGTYAESLVIDQEVTLNGAQAGVATGGRTAGSGAESILDVRGLPVGVTIKHSNVVLDGFDILGDASTYAGVMLYATTGSGSLTTIDVKGNFVHGMALPNPSSSYYVTSYGIFGLGDSVGGVRNTLTDLAIEGNEVYDLGGAVSGTDVSAGAGVWLYGVQGGGGGGGAIISGNSFFDIYDGYDSGNLDAEPGIAVAVIDDGDAVPDSGAKAAGNVYADTFGGLVMAAAGGSEVDELGTGFSGVTLLVLNAGNLSTVNEAHLAPYARTDKPTGYPASTAYAARIQDAVAYSDAGAAISVSAGTFVEPGQVVIDKDLSIVGAGRASTLVKPGSDTGGSGDAGAWILVADGITFNLSKVTLDGAGRNIRQALRYKGSGTVDDVTIQNMAYPGYLGWAIAQGYNTTTAMNLVVTNSTFTNFGRVGILLDEGAGPSTATISGNVFTGKGDGDHLDYAVEVEGGAQAAITGNAISSCRGAALSDGSTSAGILVTTYFAPGTAAEVTGNTLTDNSTAIAVGYDASDTSSVTAHDNCMSGNDWGVTSTAPLVDATENWWGDASGPAHATNPNGTGDAVSDDVDFLPWLDDCGGDVTGPVHCSSPDAWFLTIQEGIDGCDEGATVSVSPGTFAEDLVIDKALTLACANVGLDPNVVPSVRGPETIIVPASNDWDSFGTIVYPSASNITIDGCTFDGDNPDLEGGYPDPMGYMGSVDINTNAAVDTGQDSGVDHLVVRNNIVRNLLWSSVYLDNPYLAGESGNLIGHNLFHNMWEGVQTYGAHADISGNVFTDVTRGISMHQVWTAAEAGFVPRIVDNTVTVKWNWPDDMPDPIPQNVGIWLNGRHGPAPALEISGNVVNTPLPMPTGKTFRGFELSDITDATEVSFFDNTVNGDGNCDIGLYAWCIDTSDPVVASGGNLLGLKKYGAMATNDDPTWGACPTEMAFYDITVGVEPGGNHIYGHWNILLGEKSADTLRNGRSVRPPERRAPEASEVVVTVTGGTYSGGAIGIDLDGAMGTVTGATISGNGTGVYIHNGGTGTFADNCIYDNTSYGMNNTTGTPVAAGLNWWGDPTGPYHPVMNPTGTGDVVSDYVSFAPWISDECHGTATAGDWLNLRTGAFSTLAGSLAAAATGDTIQGVCSGTTPIPGGGTAGVPGVTIDLNGCVAGPGSPFVTVTANDVTVLGPGVLDGGGSPDPAVVVKAGAGNFILLGVEVRGWHDGVFLEGSVVSFKMGENFFHDNTANALHVGSGVTLGGVVTIEGNLFKDNGGPGIQNDGATVPLHATYNSWGDRLGPAGPLGDGVGANVTYAPWTFVELFLDMIPETEAIERHVPETTGFDVKLKADAAKLYGITFVFTYDTAKLTLGTTTFAAPWAGRCLPIPGLPAGSIGYYCNLLNEVPPDPEWDADGGTIATFHFTAFTGTPGNGPWTALFDISHLEVDTSASAIGGQKVFVNNAGFNDPTIPARDITDLDDGRIIIERLANYTGYVDLQGRLNDSLAVVRVYNQALRTGATEFARGTSASSGAYTTAHLAPHWLAVGTTYYLAVDRWLYLPTTPLAASSFQHSRILDGVPTTPLPTVYLLGGDASNDESILVNDLSCIGGDYGKTSGFNVCGGTGLSDVNEDGRVNVQDLSMAGGNLYKTFSPWTVP